MTRIAADAGVAEKTVYLAFPTKAELLSEIIRVAIRGDDDETPMMDRRRWREMLRSPDVEILGRFAKINEELLHRASRVLALGEAAALSDPELAAPRDRGHRAQRAVCGELARELRSRGLLAADLEVGEATDILFALTGESVHLRLVSERRWSRRRYIEWLERTLRRTLLAEL
jgi:AcrR family transcriptional regulator